MGPKVFGQPSVLSARRKPAVIASLEQALEALEGSAGTQILKD